MTEFSEKNYTGYVSVSDESSSEKVVDSDDAMQQAIDESKLPIGLRLHEA